MGFYDFQPSSSVPSTKYPTIPIVWVLRKLIARVRSAGLAINNNNLVHADISGDATWA
jgi:hypothetical protein